MDGTVENGFKEARVDVKEQEKPFLSNHGNLLMSGPLGICDDPYCTICPSYFTSSSASVSLTPYKKNPFSSGAKNMHGKLVGWSKYRLPSVMNPHSKMVQLWNQFFAISCLFAIFVDPLFFLLFSVTETYFCIIFNDTLATAVTILRSLTDFIYFLHMLLQFRLAYVVPASRTVGAGELVDDPKRIARHYLRRWFIFDVCAVLPAPQFRLAYVVPASRTVGAGELVDDPKRIARHYLRRWFIFDVCAVLPAPQTQRKVLLEGQVKGQFPAEWSNA